MHRNPYQERNSGVGLVQAYFGEVVPRRDHLSYYTLLTEIGSRLDISNDISCVSGSIGQQDQTVHGQRICVLVLGGRKIP